MHNIAKYKPYFKVKFFLIKFETSRVLNFKATKWKALQEQIKKTYTVEPEIKLEIEENEVEDPTIEFEKEEKVFVICDKSSKEESESKLEDEKIEKDEKSLESKSILDFELMAAEKSIIKLTRYYNEGLILKRGIDFYFNHYLKKNYFTKLLHYKKVSFKELLKIFLIKPFFKLEILLWHLGLFKSIRQILQLLNTNCIFINEKIACPGAIIKEGDVISFKNVELKAVETIKVLPYLLVEIDFFCNKIIVVKGYTNLNDQDINLLFPKVSFDFLKFLNYIQRQ